ncbi:tape measure protein [Fructobacillus sp. M158]|uniref:tape measure protein n=1 Tax=Fructobacillus parabroussonetiae TaxID=2713174 RepID=UPI00200B98DE|nr:tape measure protein [Fructobacillus parabroussonetiae]MCK8617559.1 tape measure protein [Fructobacillus parabroussonetiae]
MAKLTNEMANKLTLDTSSATKTLKEFTGEVKKSNNEWKVQEHQLKAAGDSIGASKARYEGLTSVVKKQTTKVDSLKLALENTNTSTDKGKKLQEKLTDELAKAERQLNSYNGQLEKASDTYKYQSSGIAKLNDDVKHNTTLTNANVRALQAEGKENEANKVKLQGLTNTRDKLNSILKKQEAELSKLSETGDKNSSAYKKQEIRVAEMRAKLAEANKEIKSMNGRGIKLNTSSLDKTREKLNSMNAAINKSNHMFAKMFGANVLSTAVTSGLTSVKTHITGMTRAGAEFNKEQQVMGATWQTLTGSADKGQEMVKSINGMSKAFGQSNDVVNELQQQFYHVFNQKEPTEKLTGSMLTLADTLGMGSAEVERLGLNFTHMMTSSKLQLGDFNMISDQLPMFGEKLLEYERKLQNNSNLTMSELRDQMSAGKISAEQATEVINELGDNYKEASENMLSTYTGMERRIKSQSKVLAGSITQPLLATKNPLFKAVSDWVADDRTVKLFDNFGQQLSKSFNTITAAFGKSFKSKDFNEFANNTMVKATNGVERFGNYVSKHSDDIIGLAKGIKVVGGSVLSTGGLIMKLLIPALIEAGKFATNHKTTFKILAGAILGVTAAVKGMMAVSKVAVAWSGLVKVMKSAQIATKAASAAQWVLNAAMDANPIGIIIVALGALVLGFIELYKHNKKFKKFVDGIVKAAKKLFEGVIKWFKKLPQNVTKLFKKVINFFKKDWKQIALFMVNPIGGAIALLYKHFKPFREFVNGIGKLFKKVFEGIGAYIKFVIKYWQTIFKTGFNVIKKVVNTAIKIVSKIIKTELNIIKNVVETIFNGIKSAIDFVIKVISKIIKTELDIINKVWTTIWGGISSFFTGIFKGISGFVGGVMRNIHSTISGVLDGVSGVWKSVWGGISDFFTGLWDGIVHTVQKAIDKIKGIIDGIKDTIGSVGKKIGKMIPHFARGGIVKANNQIVMVNDGDGEDWKELMHLPGGEMIMSHQRNAIMPLPVGTRIYSGADTKQIMAKQGIQKYAKGGVVGGNDGAYNVSNIINNFNPDKIIPVDGIKSSSGYQLLNQSAQSRPEQVITTQQSNSNVSDAKLDQIIVLLTMMLGVSREQLAKMLASGGTLNGMYNQMGTDYSIHQWQKGGVNA